MALLTLDLFSGIGGFALAGKMVGGFEVTQFVEINPYCQSILAKNFPGIPIHGDIRTYSTSARRIDVVTGGFPCQDISVANANGRGLEGDRSGLFYEVVRIIRECRPRYVVLENVHALLNARRGRDMGAVLWELSECGYDAEWQTVSAASMGAPHLRKRVFIVANPNSSRCQQLNPTTFTAGQRLNPWLVTEGGNPWGVKPGILRISNGVPHRVDRIKSLGNAVVPQCAAVALQRVLELEARSCNTSKG